MPRIDASRGEVTFKIAYDGPGLSGKTTNLLYVRDHLHSGLRGELHHQERLIWFDFPMAGLGKIQGLDPRFELSTVMGQVHSPGQREQSLLGADVVVFVADSQSQRLEANVQAFCFLQAALVAQGRSLTEVPTVLQHNKRDLPDVSSVDVLRSELGAAAAGSLEFEAVANVGIGVFETLKGAVKLTITGFARTSARG